jgi:hypothetical protein
MPKFVPGDLCYVKAGAYLIAVIGNEECWHGTNSLAVVVATSFQISDDDDDVANRYTVMLPDRGLFKVDEAYMWTPDEYNCPTRLFSTIRLREP